MYTEFNHLGFNSPFYFRNNGKIYSRLLFSDIVDDYSSPLRIDPVAVNEFLNWNHMLGDRTIIKGIKRSPWLSAPTEDNQWKTETITEYNFRNISEEKAAEMLFTRICDEIEGKAVKVKKIGVLLSGGMDSRMVAGVLDFLIKVGRLKDIEVTGLTWGNKNSRDVVYAEEIARRLGWNWKHYGVTSASLKKNIEITAINGCEFSPIHLHAIPQIEEDNRDLGLILAGSYGDSVGRAEYFGWKVGRVPNIMKEFKNFAHFLPDPVFKDTVGFVYDDVHKYHRIFKPQSEVMKKELDYQIHYMRRMLNPCLSVLNRNGSVFYQVFTAPDVYKFMFSLKENKRSDNIYKYLYSFFSTDLSDIPWSRTGLAYGKKKGNPDSHSRDHHSYVSIIRDEMYDELRHMVFSSSLEDLKIFNMKSIETVFNLIKRYPTNNLHYKEKLIWLASLSNMLKTYDIQNTNANIAQIPDQKISIMREYFKNGIRKKVGPIIKKMLR